MSQARSRLPTLSPTLAPRAMYAFFHVWVLDAKVGVQVDQGPDVEMSGIVLNDCDWDNAALYEICNGLHVGKGTLPVPYALRRQARDFAREAGGRKWCRCLARKVGFGRMRSGAIMRETPHLITTNCGQPAVPLDEQT